MWGGVISSHFLWLLRSKVVPSASKESPLSIFLSELLPYHIWDSQWLCNEYGITIHKGNTEYHSFSFPPLYSISNPFLWLLSLWSTKIFFNEAEFFPLSQGHTSPSQGPTPSINLYLRSPLLSHLYISITVQYTVVMNTQKMFNPCSSNKWKPLFDSGEDLPKDLLKPSVPWMHGILKFSAVSTLSKHSLTWRLWEMETFNFLVR